VTCPCFSVCLLLALVLLLVYGVLLVSALVQSFPSNVALTLKHFAYVRAHPLSLRNTLVYGGAAALICGCFTVLLGYLVQRREWTGRRVVDVVALLPAAVPGIFFGIGYAAAFNQRWLDWLDRGALITMSMIFWNIPIGYQAAVVGLHGCRSTATSGWLTTLIRARCRSNSMAQSRYGSIWSASTSSGRQRKFFDAHLPGSYGALAACDLHTRRAYRAPSALAQAITLSATPRPSFRPSLLSQV
jgi:hypothetical protein